MNRIQSLITNLVQSAFIVNRVRVKSLIDFVLHLVEIEKKLLKESYVKNDIFPVKIFILYLYALCRMTLRFERRIRINHISFVVKIRNKHFSIYFLYVYRFFPVSSRGSLWKYSRCRSREALFFISFPVFVSVFHCGQGMNGYEELPSQVSHDQNVWYKLPRSLLIKKDQLQLIYNIYSGNFFFNKLLFTCLIVQILAGFVISTGNQRLARS